MAKQTKIEGFSEDIEFNLMYFTPIEDVIAYINKVQKNGATHLDFNVDINNENLIVHSYTLRLETDEEESDRIKKEEKYEKDLYERLKEKYKDLI